MYALKLQQKRDRRGRFQQGINEGFALSPNVDRTAGELRNFAAAEHADYPQYAGHFDGYRLVRVSVDVRTKAGLAFKAGDVAIATYRAGLQPGFGRWIVYSVRNGCDTQLTYAVHELK